MSVHTCVQAPTETGRGRYITGTGVVGSFELSDTGDGNGTRVHGKSHICLNH